MPNPYTRFGFSSTTDEEEEEFKPAPEKTYGTKYTGKTKRRNPYTSFGFSDEEKEPDRSSIDRLLDKGKSWEDIAKETGFSLEEVQSYSQQTRPDYGIKKGPSNISKVGGIAKAVGRGIAQGPKILASGGARALGAGEETEGQRKATASLDSTQKRILEVLRDPSVPQQRKETLLGLLNEQNRESVLQALESTKEVESETDKRKFLAASAELALTAAGGGTYRAAKSLGLGGRAALLGAEGATFGTLGALEQEKVTPGSVAVGAGAGLGLGALLPIAGAQITKFRAGKVADDLLPTKVGRGADIITDERRLLTATAGESGGASSKFIQRIEQDPRTAVIAKGADVADVNRLNVIDKQIQTAQQTGNLSATDARALMRERQAVVERIQNPQTVYAREITAADERIAQATTKTERARAVQEKEFLQRQAVVEARNANVADDLSPLAGTQKVAGQAKTTEARAISEGLTEEMEGLATYGTTTWDDQAQRAVDIMNTDYEAAKRIAKGLQPPPEGVLGNAVYKGVENRAVREGDAQLLRELAQAPTASRTSRAAQELGVLGARDPESPLVAMKEIMEARKTSGLAVSHPLSKQEAETITNLAKQTADAKATLAGGGSKKAYGDARVAFDNYINDLRLAASRPKLKESLQTLGFYGKTVKKAAGLAKSLVATLDNSVIGRQGWKTLMTNPRNWAKNSLKSFKDIADTYGGKEVLDHVHADMVSRDNALNGLYKTAGLDVYGAKKSFLEEAFPVSFQKLSGSKVGRQILKPFKASEVAFTAWQQRTRADLFDQYIDLARKTGVDLGSKKEVAAIGKMVNSLTSRGHLGRTGERFAEGFNIAFFAPKLVKSNVDVLGGHIITGAGGSSFVRKQAAKNLLKIAVGSAAALKLAEAATGGKVEADPRSSNFGKIQVGSTRFDLSGGMAGLLTLGSRVITDTTKSSNTGEVKKLNTGEFGSQTTWDVILGFAENKLSPGARSFVDWKKGEDFNGNKPTIASTVKNLTMPLIIQQYGELKNDPNSANIVAAMIAEGLGISANTYSMTSNWNANNGKKISAFKEKVSKETFEAANKDFNNQFNDWYTQVSKNDKFWSLPIEQRESLVTKKKNDLTNEVLESRGFKYKTPKKSTSNQQLVNDLLKYGR